MSHSHTMLRSSGQAGREDRKRRQEEKTGREDIHKHRQRERERERGAKKDRERDCGDMSGMDYREGERKVFG